MEQNTRSFITNIKSYLFENDMKKIRRNKRIENKGI